MIRHKCTRWRVQFDNDLSSSQLLDAGELDEIVAELAPGVTLHAENMGAEKGSFWCVHVGPLMLYVGQNNGKPYVRIIEGLDDKMVMHPELVPVAKKRK